MTVPPRLAKDADAGPAPFSLPPMIGPARAAEGQLRGERQLASRTAAASPGHPQAAGLRGDEAALNQVKGQEGSLATQDVADLIQQLHEQRWTGALILSHAGLVRKIAVSE